MILKKYRIRLLNYYVIEITNRTTNTSCLKYLLFTSMRINIIQKLREFSKCTQDQNKYILIAFHVRIYSKN